MNSYHVNILFLHAVFDFHSGLFASFLVFSLALLTCMASGGGSVEVFCSKRVLGSVTGLELRQLIVLWSADWALRSGGLDFSSECGRQWQVSIEASVVVTAPGARNDRGLSG